MTLYYLVKLLI